MGFIGICHGRHGSSFDRLCAKLPISLAKKFNDRVDATKQALDYLQERMDGPGLLAYYRIEVESMHA